MTGVQTCALPISPKKLTLNDQVAQIQEKFNVVGREKQLKMLLVAIRANKHVIMEGVVGTGKTYLAQAIAEFTDSKFIRVDGSEDVYAHTLTGYFDPPAIMSEGYKEDSFIYGPLTNAMQDGAVLFINELNRLPEQTQNVLLSALDEKKLIIPKLKTVQARKGFILISTQNPAAHVGVSALGEALKDRFVWIDVSYQDKNEEIEIVCQNLDSIEDDEVRTEIADIAVSIVRETRDHPEIRQGASIRGAIDLAQLVQSLEEEADREFWFDAAVMAIHTKIEIVEGADRSSAEILADIVDRVLDHF